MALKYSEKLRNAQMDMIMAVLKNLTITSSAITGTASAPVLQIRDGAIPANCAASDTGLLLAEISLTTTAFNAAATGQIVNNGTWSDPSSNFSGTASYFRFKDSTGACHIQGSISGTGGGGDLQLSSTSIVAGQVLTITGFTISAGNA